MSHGRAVGLREISGLMTASARGAGKDAARRDCSVAGGGSRRDEPQPSGADRRMYRQTCGTGAPLQPVLFPDVHDESPIKPTEEKDSEQTSSSPTSIKMHEQLVPRPARRPERMGSYAGAAST